MTISHDDYTNIKKVLAISLAAIMVFGSFSLGSLTADYSAYGAKANGGGKKGNPIDWSNGAPSGPHHNLIIHGKKADYNCDNSPGGGSVFVPTYTDGKGNQTIEFVSNQKSKIENLTALDPCSEHYDGSPIQVQIPYEDSGYYVYWALKGKPQNGKNSDQNVSNFTLAGPNIVHYCNVTEAGSMVKEGDSDIMSPLMNFTNFTKYADDLILDNAFSVNETVYRDLDLSSNVTDGDKRLANSDLGLDVTVGDSDIDTELLVFLNGTEMYRDTDLSGNYSIGEPIYDDSTGSIPNEVDAGDTRLFVKDGSEALSCLDDDDLINGAGYITDKEAFALKNGTLQRWEDPNATTKKGKNQFTSITGLFQWTGAVCDSSILTWDDPLTNIYGDGDGYMTIGDFDTNGNNVIDKDDLQSLGFAVDDASALAIINNSEAAVPGDAGIPINDNDFIDTESEFAAFMEYVFGSTDNCTAIYDIWVFNLAQIVVEGLQIKNDGGLTVQVRFYPVDTTVITPQ